MARVVATTLAAMPRPTRIDSIVAVVTGASSGIGAAVARRLAGEAGARLLLVARRADRLDALAAELPAAAALAVDLTDDAAPGAVLDRVRSRFGVPNLLVNNAGASFGGDFAAGGYADVARTMRLNFDAAVRLTEALLPSLQEAAPSAVVNVASTAARVARPGTGAYSASKAALAMWSDALAVEERTHGVHVGTVYPGFVSTEGFPQSGLVGSRLGGLILGSVEEVAEAVVDVGLRGRAERYVPRKYAVAAIARAGAPPVVRRILRTSLFR